MKKNNQNVLFLMGVIIISYSCNNQTSNNVKPPVAKKIAKELTLHNDIRTDNYYWMNERENPEVIAYLEAENAYTEAMMKHTEELQVKLYDEIVGRIKQTDESVPYKLNGYYYYTRYEEGKEYPIYCRKYDNMQSPEEIMLNVNEMAEGYAFYQVGGYRVSEDNEMIAYSVDTVSRRKYTIHFKSLVSREIFEETIPNTSGNIAWSNDNKTIFYATKDETLRPDKIYRHELGTSISDDQLVYHETDPTFTTFIKKSKSREYLLIGSRSTLSTEYRYLDANEPKGEFRVIQPRTKDLEYSVEQYQDKFFIKTNYEARNFCLMETPLNKTTLENWKVLIPHRDDVLLEDFEVFKGYLALNERKNGLPHLRIIDWIDDKDFYIDFTEQTYMAFFSANPEFNTDSLRYGYSSLTVPFSTYDYNMKTGERTLLKQQEVIGGYNPDDYFAERLLAPAKDGTMIPISLVYKKGLKKDGNNPTLLYGYGSYGASMSPYFSSVRLSLLDRGFVYAIAHIRGGEEMGRYWYEDGKLLKKKNTFTDFIACGQYLVKQKFTNTNKLFGAGGSAGGLLIGAVINMSPELFKGAIAAVPFVDVITTMLDESIPLTTGEYDEWGNPNDKEYYDYMLSYSPYDNVEEKEYPNLLVTTGLHDSQVQYWEPAKWVAKLRQLKTDNNLLILKTNMDFGHSGASGRFERYKETALEYAFLLELTGVDD